MNRKLRRYLSLALALLVALPSLGLAESIDAPVQEVDYLLGETPELSLPDGEEDPGLEPQTLELEPEAVELSDSDLTSMDAAQTVEVDELRFTLEGGTDAVLSVEPVSEARIAEASRAALGLEDGAEHRLYRIALQGVEADGPVLNVEGLDLSDGRMARVAAWDEASEVCTAIDAMAAEGVLSFTYAGPAVYDIVIFNTYIEEETAQPTAVRFETEPAGARVEVFAEAQDSPLLPEEDGGYWLLPGEYYYTVSAEGFEAAEGIFTVGSEPLIIAAALKETAALVSVRFETEPAEAKATVFAKEGEEPLLPEGDGYQLLPGAYRYTVSAEGFEAVEGTFTVEGEPVTIAVKLKKSEAAEVRFELEPAEAKVEVFAAAGAELILPGADGGYLLQPGDYCYNVTAEGYDPFEGAFTVEGEPLVIIAALTAVEVSEPEEAMMDVTPDDIADWADLQALIDEAEDGATITLGDSLTADPDIDTALFIPEGKKLTLDLNGCTLNRGLEWPEPEGSAIIVEGELILEDSVGTGVIMGGYAEEHGGGVLVRGGRFTMNGGTIEHNYADVSGGGVCVGTTDTKTRCFFTMNGGAIRDNYAGEKGGGVANYYNFTMKGGQITANEADLGGGVYSDTFLNFENCSVTGNNYEDIYMTCFLGLDGLVDIGTVKIAPGPRGITEEFFKLGENLSTGKPIFLDVDDKLMENGRVWFGTCPDKNMEKNQRLLACFEVNEEKHRTMVDDFGLAYISRRYNLRLTTGLHDAEDIIVPLAYGEAYTLPEENPFENPPAHLTLIGWRMGPRDGRDNERALGESVSIDSNVAVTARWTMDWAGLREMVESAGDGDVLTLPCDVIREGRDTRPVEIPEGMRLTLDLNGYTLDGNGENIDMLRVRGGHLTLRDSIGGGRITGSESDAILLMGGSLTMQGGAISGNRSGVYVDNNSEFVLQGGEISDNLGTGVSVFGKLTMDGGVISGNRDHGVYVTGTLDLNGGAIRDNSANTDGGGILASGASATINMTGGAISGNRTRMRNGTESWGGGLSMTLSSTFNMTGGVIEGNMANRGGGICVKSGSVVNLRGGSISGNTTLGTGSGDANQGGGIYAISSTVNLEGGSVSGNSAYIGGGLYLEGSTCAFDLADDSIIRGNTAQRGGAGLALEGITLNLPLELPRITGNTVNGAEFNYWLAKNSRIHIAKSLTADEVLDVGAPLGDHDAPAIITFDSGYCTEDNFFSPEADRAFAIDQDFNVVYGKAVPVIFEKGDDGAEGEMAQDAAVLSAEYTMPVAAFLPPKDKDFIGWRLAGDTTDTLYPAENDLFITGDMLDAEGHLVLTAAWGEGVKYVDQYDDVHTCGRYTYLKNVKDEKGVTLRTGWYIAQGESFKNRVTIDGDVKIIITKGTVTRMRGGILLKVNNRLTVYGQEGWNAKDGGKLEAIAEDKLSSIGMAGIGGETMIAGGEFVLCSGFVEAKGRANAAGLGGGYASCGGPVTIYNGKLIATGGNYGAGIGGGLRASQGKGSVSIYDGEVHAIGGMYAAGIGGGQHYNTERLGDDETGGNGGLVFVYGGKVEAKGGTYGAGIGGGQYGIGGSVTIVDGAEVVAATGVVDNRYATDKNQAQAIGRGYLKTKFNEEPGSLVLSPECSVLAGDSEKTATAYSGDGCVDACRKLWAKITSEGAASGHTLIVATYNPDIGKVQLFRQGNEKDEITRASRDEVVVVKVSMLDGDVSNDLKLSYIWRGRVRPFVPKTRTRKGFVETYTFIMPEGDVQIDPGLTIKTRKINFVDDPHGTLAAYVDGKRVTEASKVDEVTIKASPDVENSYFLQSMSVIDDETHKDLKPIQAEDENVYTFNMPDHTVTVSGEFWPGVKYIDENGIVQVHRYYETVTSKTIIWDGDGLGDGWYYVKEDVTINSRVEIKCNAILVLGEGATLNCKKGIRLPKKWGSTLTIYGQTAKGGTLLADADGQDDKAGIGGNDEERGGTVKIYGGTVKAWGGSSGAGIGGGDAGWGGSLTVKLADVYAYGGEDAAGIGGGEDRSIDGTIEIFSGYVYAEGGEDGAGIGGGQGGDQRGHVIVRGGKVSAHGGHDAAGIGGGDYDRGGGDGGKVTIYGGEVYAYGGTNGAGIGGGNDGDAYDKFESDTVTITGGYVYAQGGGDGAGIGGADDGNGGKVIVKGGIVEAFGGNDSPGIGGGDDGKGGTFIMEGGTVTVEGKHGGAGIGGGRNEKGGSVTIKGGYLEAKCTGDSSFKTAIGGGKGNSDEGSLDIADQMSVTRKNSSGNMERVEAGLRVSACRTSDRVIISTCLHPSSVPNRSVPAIQKDADVHTIEKVCLYCMLNNIRADEPHMFRSGGACEICGYNPWHNLIPRTIGSGNVIIESGMRAKNRDTVKVTAVPKPGYRYASNWVVTPAGNVRTNATTKDGITTITFTMPDWDTHVTVVFEKVPYAITAEYDDLMGTVEVPDMAHMGDVVTVQATPDRGFALDNIEVLSGKTPIEVDSEGRFTMPEHDVNVKVTFVPLGRATVYEAFADIEEDWGAPEGPLPDQPIGSYTVPKGVYAEYGYRVACYSMDGGKTLTPVKEGESINIPGDCDLIIYYKGIYTISFKANGGGGEMAPAHAARIGAFPLPDSGFTPPQGMAFIGWTMEGVYGILHAEDEIEIDGDVELTAQWEYTEPQFKSHSLVLSGDIGVNFFMALPELEDVDYEESYMEFTVNGKTTRADFDSDFQDVNGKGYYGFTAYVSSIQMAEPIHAVFHYGDGKTIEQDYSVKDYILAFEKVSAGYDKTTIALVHALADYGHHIQPCLAKAHNWKIGRDYKEMDVYYTESLDQNAVAQEVAGYKIKTSGKKVDNKCYTYTVNAETRTELILLIKPDAQYGGDISVAVDGKRVEPRKQADGRYRVSGGGVSAHQLDETHTFTLKMGSIDMDITFSPLAYINGILTKSKVSENRVGVAAMYYYYKAAENFRAAHNYS